MIYIFLPARRHSLARFTPLMDPSEIIFMIHDLKTSFKDLHLLALFIYLFDLLVLT